MCVKTLSKDNREALKIYRKNMPMHNLSNAELRTWQQWLLDNISAPSNCEVIWLWGQTGNKGKTWFQGYLETLYRYARVVWLDLKMKTANVLHALIKQPLSTKDNSCSTKRDQLATIYVTIPFCNQSKMVVQYHQGITTMLYNLKFQTLLLYFRTICQTQDSYLKTDRRYFGL